MLSVSLSKESLILLWKEIIFLTFDYGTLLTEQSQSLKQSLLRGDIHPRLLIKQEHIRSCDLPWWREHLDELGSEIERIGSLIELTVKPLLMGVDDRRVLPPSLMAVLKSRLKMAKKLIINAMEHSLLLSPHIMGRLFCSECWGVIGGLLNNWNIILKTPSTKGDGNGLRYYISCSLLRDLPRNPLHQLMIWWEEGLLEMSKAIISMNLPPKQQKEISTLHRMFRLCKRMMKKIYKGGLLLFLTNVRSSEGLIGNSEWIKEVCCLEEVTLLGMAVIESMNSIKNCYLKRKSSLEIQFQSSLLIERTSGLVNFIVGEVGDFCVCDDGSDVCHCDSNEDYKVMKDIEWMNYSQGRLERWLIPIWGPMR